LETKLDDHQEFLAYHAGDVFGEEEEDYWHIKDHPDNNKDHLAVHIGEVFGEEDEDYWHINHNIKDANIN
jgi:hypothetical protein